MSLLEQYLNELTYFSSSGIFSLFPRGQPLILHSGPSRSLHPSDLTACFDTPESFRQMIQRKPHPHLNHPLPAIPTEREDIA